LRAKGQAFVLVLLEPGDFCDISQEVDHADAKLQQKQSRINPTVCFQPTIHQKSPTLFKPAKGLIPLSQMCHCKL